MVAPAIRRLLLPALLILLGALPGTAQAASYAPARGTLHGGTGGYDAGAVGAFTAQAGKHPAVYQYFTSWNKRRNDFRWLERILRQTDRARSRALLCISTTRGGLSPRAIARGDGDGYLLGLNRLLAGRARPTYLRLLSEMNNGDNPYSAYDLRGRSRGPAFSTRQFRRAWRRSVLVLRGGDVASIDAKLKRLRMPAVKTSARTLGRPPVAFLWIPLSFGNPEVARNHPRHWWPGSGYVDWVGTTWYSPFLAVSAMSRFYYYPLWRNKPFAFGEYAVRGAESPGFIRLFFRFVRGHRRVRMIVYNQSGLLRREFRLSAHPRSRAVLRRALKSSRYLSLAPEFR